MIAIRASSLSTLLDCPARWAAEHIDGKRLPRSPAAQIGTAFHAGAAAFDASRLDGASPISIDDAAGVLVDAIQRPQEDVDWDQTPLREAERTALRLHTTYCSELAPQQHYTAVELTCEKLELPELNIALTGTTDRVREVRGKYGIGDLKSGVNVVSKFGLVKVSGYAFQQGAYELIAEYHLQQPMTMPAVIFGMSTAAHATIATEEIRDAKALLVGDGEQPGVLEYASTLIQAGLFYGNPKSMLCHKKYCPIFSTCRFRR